MSFVTGIRLFSGTCEESLVCHIMDSLQGLNMATRLDLQLEKAWNSHMKQMITNTVSKRFVLWKLSNLL